MKQVATILCIGIIGFAQAQSTSKDVEIYERYENGELVEQRQSATENGTPIKDFDFEKVKRDMQLKSAEMEVKLQEMSDRFEQSRKKMEISMEKRMTDFEKRSEEIHKRMDQRMKEMDSKSKKVEKPTLTPEEQPIQNLSTKEVKFT